MLSHFQRAVPLGLSLLAVACGAPEEPQRQAEHTANTADAAASQLEAGGTTAAQAPAAAEPDDITNEQVAPEPAPPPSAPATSIAAEAEPEPAPTPPAPPQAFAACRSCHSVEPGAAPRIGPNLFGVVNAPAGRLADFSYSDAMAQADFAWTEEQLDAFLLAPRDVVPGNRMMAAPVRDPAARREIIAYLASLQ